MTVAFDAVTTNAAGAASYTHTPVGTPRGVLLLINIGNADETDTWAPTYGGVAMGETPSSPFQGNSAVSDRNSSLRAFILGSSVPTGAQTVALGQTGSETVLNSACYTVTAGGDVELAGEGTLQETGAVSPTYSIPLSGKTSFAAQIFRAGPNDVSKITPWTNWTADLEEDFGSASGGIYSYDIIGSTDITAGWDNDVSDDGVVLGVAITEVSGGAVNLVVQDATHSHSADNIALTQQNTLAVAEAAHAHAADNIDLTQQHQLSVAEALHGHNADNVEVSTAIFLAVAAALHAHGADDVVLSQQNILAIADALHGHVSDNISLVQQNSLIVESALHSQSADNLVLDFAALLAIASALHGHTADNITLEVGDILGVAESIITHTADTIVLTQQSFLVVNDALHAHIASNINLAGGGVSADTGAVFSVQAGERVYFVVNSATIFRVVNSATIFRA